MAPTQQALGLHSVGLLCALVGALLYLNTLDCGFCFDDDVAVEKNLDLRPNVSWSNLLKNDFWGNPMSGKDSHKSYRPMCVATFRLNYLLHELQPMGYHLVNVLLHSAVCFLYVQLCGVVFGEAWPALIAGLLFAVHPIHTEAVAGVVGRADVLAALFYLGTLLSYRRAVLVKGQEGYRWLFLSLVLCLCSALSKETGITAMAVCLVYEFFIMHKMDLTSSVQLLQNICSGSQKKIPGWLRNFLIRVILLAVVTIVFLVFRVKLNQGPPIFSTINNPAMAFETPYRQLHWAYLCVLDLWLLLCPFHLCAEYAMSTIPPISSTTDPRNLLTLVTFTGVAIVGLYSISGKDKHRKIVVMALSLMVIPFIPASNLFFPVGFVIAERVLYIPSMGFTLLIGYAVLHIKIINQKVINPITKLSLVWLLLFQSTKTALRNRDWISSIALFSSAVQTTPGNAKMFSNLAAALDVSGNRTAAEELFGRAIQLEPYYITGYLNLAYVVKEEGRIDEALEIYYKAADLVTRGLGGENIHVGPKNVKVYNTLADMLQEHTGNLEEAYQFSLKAVKNEPEWDTAHNTKGFILLKMGKFPEALAAFKETIRINPESVNGHSNLGETYRELGDLVNAEKLYRKALSLNDTHILTEFRLAAMIVKMRTSNAQKLLEAEKMLLDVLAIEPDNGNATFSLGLAYFDLQNFNKSEELFLRTLEITPNDTGTMYNLGVMLANIERYTEAMEYLKLLRQVKPDHLDGLAQLGTCYLQMNQSEKSKEAFESVLEQDPAHQMALNNLGLLMMRLRDYDEAIKIFTEIVRLEPSNERAQRQLMVLHEHKNKRLKPSDRT